MPPVHVRPGLHLFIGWHEHPSEPAIQSVLSTAPEASAGTTHVPELQTPLAQSGPVLQVVLGSFTVGMQSPPVHVPLWQSLAWLQREPAGTPELEPPLAVELSPAIERPPPETDKVTPPEAPAPARPMSVCLPAQAAKGMTARPTKSSRDERLGT